MQQEIYDKLDYVFSDEQLLITAFNHPSINKTNKKLPNYQRLELLGDSVLYLVITEILLNYYPNSNEGEISIRRANLICTKVLADITNKLELNKFIAMSYSEERQGGRYSQKILEDIMESVIGALYVDGGLNIAKKFIEKHWEFYIKEQKKDVRNAKTRLQEWTQGQKHKIPIYSSVAVGSGKDTHYKTKIEFEQMPIFEVIVKTKKEGENLVAEKLIEYIKENVDNGV